MPLTHYVPTPKFEEYRKTFAEHFVMERRDGIIELRMHTLGGDVQWNFELHRAIWQAFQTVGADPENRVMILTATGDTWTPASTTPASPRKRTTGPSTATSTCTTTDAGC